ncbi:MAG: radical SAM protein [Elusimicrobiota bacterium]
MYFSKYNIFSKLEDSEDYFILNLLTGNADILSPQEGKKIEGGKLPENSAYVEKGYVADPAKEEELYERKLKEFNEKIGNEEVQIFFVPWYGCNFNCSYCFQNEYDKSGPPLTKDTIDSFFEYVKREFKGRKKYITLFGGEPLLEKKRYRRLIDYFVSRASKNNLELAVVTNGYTLSSYLDILKKARIREIQVTLDGPLDIHDKRRSHVNGRGSFEKIVNGIQSALDDGFTINLRTVLDRDNLDGLPELSRFVIEKGWNENPDFKTQIGRNYDLHGCGLDKEKILSRAGLYEKIYDMAEEYPEILKFHLPDFSVSRFLYQNGRLPDAAFDVCPATKSEWAFDYTGRIYPCTAYVGVKKESLGTFYPEVNKSKDLIKKWNTRSVETINECRECSLKLACGGGCGAVAKNATGNIKSPDCNPVKRQLELGVSLYFNKELKEFENDSKDKVCNC